MAMVSEKCARRLKQGLLSLSPRLCILLEARDSKKHAKEVVV